MVIVPLCLCRYSVDKLSFINTKECLPWRYAIRQADNYGDFTDLITSIRVNAQLQPALVRKHPRPQGDIKYEVIFGCRRLRACEELGIPLLAILHKDMSDKVAASYQHDENKKRNDSSPYSDAQLYRKMLSEGLFHSEYELAKALSVSKSTINDLLAFTKIPQAIINSIPNIHNLSKNMAVKISRIINANPANYEVMLKLAPEVGRAITSPQKLEKYFSDKKASLNQPSLQSRVILDHFGEPLFTLGFSALGAPIVKMTHLSKSEFDTEAFCDYLKAYFD